MKRQLLKRFQNRSIARAVRLNRITPGMGQNRLAMMKITRPLTFFLLGVLLLNLVILIAGANEWISVQWGVKFGIIVSSISVVASITMTIKAIGFARTERRLRRAAILNGYLRPRFPDRIWARWKGRVMAGGAG